MGLNDKTEDSASDSKCKETNVKYERAAKKAINSLEDFTKAIGYVVDGLSGAMMTAVEVLAQAQLAEEEEEKEEEEEETEVAKSLWARRCDA